MEVLENLSAPILNWLQYDNYQYPDDMRKLSVTTFIRSPRAIIANMRYFFPKEFPKLLRLSDKEKEDYFAKTINFLGNTQIGTAIHSHIEKSWKENPETKDIPVSFEKRTEKAIDGFIISGQYDYVIGGELHDIKTSKCYSYADEDLLNKYKLQCSLYRWLFKDEIQSDYAVIDRIFTDFTPNSFQAGENYPPDKCVSISIPLLSIQETEEYIHNKIATINKHLNSPLEEIPCCDIRVIAKEYKYYKSGYEEGKRATKRCESLEDAMNLASAGGNVVEFVKHSYGCNFCRTDTSTVTNVIV